jgi:hypothetical protein
MQGLGGAQRGSPENAGDVFASGEQESANVLVGLPVDGGRNEEVLDCVVLEVGTMMGMMIIMMMMGWKGRTVVDLLEGDDAVWGQTLLRVLIEQKRLGGDGAGLGWRHGAVVDVGVHVCGRDRYVWEAAGEGSKGPAEFEDAGGEAQSEWKIDQRQFEI